MDKVLQASWQTQLKLGFAHFEFIFTYIAHIVKAQSCGKGLSSGRASRLPKNELKELLEQARRPREAGESGAVGPEDSLK
jgi:hypothetical protein